MENNIKNIADITYLPELTQHLFVRTPKGISQIRAGLIRTLTYSHSRVRKSSAH